MPQGYYTLDEAARVLKMSVDDLKMIVRRGEVRAFQGGSTMHFRIQDIDEMARRRGIGSAPELPLGEVATPRSTDSPAPKPKSKVQSGTKQGGDVFALAPEKEDETADIGRPSAGGPGSQKLSPTPTPGSDSDVRLVGGDDFNLEVDSNVKMTESPKPSKRSSRLAGPSGASGPMSPRPSSRLGDAKKSGPGGPSSPRPSSKSDPKKTAMSSEVVDSGARLVPMDSDSDVRILPPDEVALGSAKPPSGTDSDVRMERSPAPARPANRDEEMLTEEINLDEELRRQEAARAQGQPPQAKVRPRKPTQQPSLPTTSPFELSESQVTQPPEEVVETSPVEESSSDFELTPASESSSPLEITSDEFKVELPESGVGLGQTPAKPELKGPSSGINLDNPVDSGISLEQGGEGSDEIEFELTLDGGEAKPGGAALEGGSSSEFELTLDADDAKKELQSDSEFELTLGVDESSSSEESPAASESSSEFELTLDAEGSSPKLQEESTSDSDFEIAVEGSSGESAAVQDSDSEFELSLDDSSGSVELESTESGDIFEEGESGADSEESGSEAVVLEEGDTDLESSDFDIALGEEDVAPEDESSSQAVALEEEDEEAGPVPRGRRGRGAPALEEEEPGFGGLDEEEGAVEEEEAAPQPVMVAAPWGPLPVIFGLPAVVVLFLVGLMGFELIQNMNGYHSPGIVTKAITGLLPK
jgi:hypothetical protein